MPWNQIPTYRLSLEPAGEKKPRAKTPFLEMSRSPGESGLALVSWSSDWQKQIRSRKMKTVRQIVPIVPSPFISETLTSHEARK